MHHTKKQSQGRRAAQPLIIIALLALAAAGCKHGNAINFVTNTQFGVKVGVNAEKIPEINIGYSRQEAARVPVYLETSKDQLSASPPTINALLNSATDSLNKAKATPWGPANADAVKVARQLIDKCIAMDTASATNTTSTLLREIKTAADELSVDPAKSTAPDNVEFVRQLIFAEMSKPRFFAEFNEHAKYIGTRSGDNIRDAYSVVGTFRGGGSGSTTGAQANLKIAQYFATGVAAQILAKEGGAALVNPSAKAPGVDQKEVQRIIDETKKAMANAETIAKKIWKKADDTDRNQVERKTELEKALKELRTDEERKLMADGYSALDTQAKLKARLENAFTPSELTTMLNNLNAQ